MRAFLKLLVIAPVLLALFLRPSAGYAEPDIVVKSSQHENAYPARIRFKLEAESSADITRVKLNYRLLGNPTSTYAYPEYTPAKAVEVEYVLNTQKTYLPPEVEIRYYWEIEDAAGHKLRTQATTFTVSDTRFQWRRIEEGNVAILWYQGNDDFARGLLASATRALDQLSKDAGIKPKEGVKILAYASQADLLGALEPGAHEWTGGRSFSAQSIIVIAIPPSASGQAFAARAIPHELSHVVIHQATDNPYGDIPQWLNEGLAMYSEGELEETYRLALDRAVRESQLLSLKTLSSNFPADPQQAALSYAESYSVVEFIIDRYGRDRMARLLEVFGQGSTYDAATKAALGVTVEELEREWRASLGAAQPTAKSADTPTAETTPVGAVKPSTSPEASQKGNERCGGLPLIAIAVATALAIRRNRV